MDDEKIDHECYENAMIDSNDIDVQIHDSNDVDSHDKREYEPMYDDNHENVDDDNAYKE